MPKKSLTDEQAAYLRLIAPGKSAKECTDLLNEHFGSFYTLKQIRSYKKNHQIVSGMQSWKFIDYSKLSIMTDEQHQWILDHARGLGNRNLTEKLNEIFGTGFTITQIVSYKKNHNITSGLTGHFTKGHTPITKGTKGMFNVGGNKTSFKVGGKPLNADSIGTEKLLSDGYVVVKINDIPKARRRVNWDQKQRIIYQQVYGAIPEDHVVIFADGDKTNFDPGNLILVSRSELLIMNKKKLITDNIELTKTGALVAKLIDKTSKVAKSQNDE